MNDRLARLTYKVNLPGGQTRLREMILHVSALAESAPRFGKTKLNKMLWRADFTAFAARGVPVTGRAYQRLPRGPAPIEMAPVLGEMLNDRAVRIDRRVFSNEIAEDRIIPLVTANRHFFSDDDLSYVGKAVDYYWDETATEVSEDSHGLAWKTREDGDPMPYEGAYLWDRKLPIDAEHRLLAMAKERHWKTL